MAALDFDFERSVRAVYADRRLLLPPSQDTGDEVDLYGASCVVAAYLPDWLLGQVVPQLQAERECARFVAEVRFLWDACSLQVFLALEYNLFMRRRLRCTRLLLLWDHAKSRVYCARTDLVDLEADRRLCDVERVRIATRRTCARLRFNSALAFVTQQGGAFCVLARREWRYPVPANVEEANDDRILRFPHVVVGSLSGVDCVKRCIYGVTFVRVLALPFGL